MSQIDLQEESLKILGKGMVTIPKSWRDELGFSEGSIVRAKKHGSQIIIEPLRRPAPYRVYSQDELMQFVKDDKI